MTKEQKFDKKLDRLGELYEDLKQHLHRLPYHKMSEAEKTDAIKAYSKLTILRDFAAVNLKEQYEIS